MRFKAEYIPKTKRWVYHELQPTYLNINLYNTFVLAEQIDDSSLVLLTDEHLKNMGITQAGPRIIILNYIDEVKATVVAPKPIALNSELQVTRAMFESDSDFANKYLYRVLDRDGIPDEQGIHQITKISCKQLVQRAFQNGQ